MNKSIINPSGEKIDYCYQQANANTPSDWLYVIGHGVTGNKDRPIVVDSAKALNDAGFDTLAFSFAGNGASEGRFQDATISKETHDLTAVLDALADRKIAYAGHSMGAAVGVLVASKDARIRRLVSLAGMVDTKKFAETEFGAETPDQGVMWEDQSCPLSQAFMTDLRETISNVIKAAKSIQVPWLLLHGSEDDVVPIADSESIIELKKQNVSFSKIQGADHSFNHAARATAMEALGSWAKTGQSS